MSETGVLLKRDKRGRVRVPRERQEALLDEFERSGVSGAKFAALSGVKYPSFAGWVQRRRKERSAALPAAAEAQSAGSSMRWLEAVAEAPGAAQSVIASSVPALEVQLPGGARMEIAHRAQALLAAELLRALGAGSTGARSC